MLAAAAPLGAVESPEDIQARLAKAIAAGAEAMGVETMPHVVTETGESTLDMAKGKGKAWNDAAWNLKAKGGKKGGNRLAPMAFKGGKAGKKGWDGWGDSWWDGSGRRKKLL